MHRTLDLLKSLGEKRAHQLIKQLTCTQLLRSRHFIWLMYLGGLFALCGIGCNEDDQLTTYPLINKPAPAFCGPQPDERALCPRPWLPYLDQAPLGGRLDLTHSAGVRVQVGTSREIERQAPELWSDDPQVTFSSLGLVRVFVRVGPSIDSQRGGIDCAEEVFSHVYEVVDRFSPQAEEVGSEAISMGDSKIIAWGMEYSDVYFGEGLSPLFQSEDKGLGPAEGEVLSAVSLGRGGRLTFYFPEGVANGPGPDFAIFENSFNDFFLELATVEVSSDGVSFTPLPHAYLGGEPLGAFGEHDPTLIWGLAGKYRAGYGTPFDLTQLAWSPDSQSGVLDLHDIRYIRVVDVVGDGMSQDSFQRPLYDPYPTQGSAGFDLDAIGVIHSSETAPCPLQK